MSERLLSGHSRLDGVLGGGLLVDAINMLIGLPGTGKTILAQQYLFANATLERPGLYLATVSEPFDKILRYGQSLRFFDPEAVGHSVFYEDLGPALNERGLAGVLEQVSALIKERRPGIMVIDSFKALSAYAEAAEFDKAVSTQREALALLQNEKQKRDLTTRLRLYESNSPYHEP